jgi:hypothetical protein
VDVVLNKVPAKIRLVKYYIGKKLYVLGTSFLSAKEFPIYKLKKLYKKRWRIEEFYKTKKSEFKIEQFHSKSTIGVKQELSIFYSLVVLARMLELQTQKKAKNLGKTGKSNRKGVLMSFIQAIPLLMGDCRIVRKKTLKHIISSMLKNLHKVYTDRSYPRVSKRPTPKWRPTTKPRKKPETKRLQP